MDWRNSDNNNCQVPIPTFWWRGEKSYPKITYSYPGEVIPINCYVPHLFFVLHNMYMALPTTTEEGVP